MKPQGLNLFIVDENPLLVTRLSTYLADKFGNSVNIFPFYSGYSVLKKIDKNTNIVILDYNLNGSIGNDILKSIKKINPKTEVIMLTSNEDVGTAIDSFRNGASDYVIKGLNDRREISILVYEIITYPIKLLGKEFKVNKHLAILLFIIIIMGIGIYFAMHYTT